MMENDTESLVADAIVNQLPKSPGPSDLSKLPQMQLDSNSLSGLSVLQSEPAATGKSSATSSQFDASGMGLMANVLERTSKGDDTTKPTIPAAKLSRRPAKAKEEPEKQEQTMPSSMLSPRKRPPVKGGIENKLLS